MDLRRSKYIPKSRTIWETKGAPSVTNDPKVTKNTVRTKQQTVLKLIVVDSFSKTLEINENQLPELSEYDSSLILQYQRSKLLAEGLSQLDTF